MEFDVKAAVADIEATSDLLERALKLAGLITALFQRHGFALVVVGGSAVEFYTEGGYMSGDIDFCRVRHGKIIQFIQVAYTIEGQKTRKREITPLFAVAKKTGCTKLLLITDHERETISQDGFTIEVVPVREWLLAK